MQNSGTITIVCDKEKITLDINSILYVKMSGNNAFLHISRDFVYQTRMTFIEIQKLLGDNFINIKRGCLVAAMAVHNITDKVNLCNGESLDYTVRKKNEIIEKLQAKQEEIITGLKNEKVPDSVEKYREHYQLFDTLPIAFTDIEMVFDKECHAIDWIFRYGNPALAELEKIPLEKMIGSSFGSLFPNMDAKWLRSYERAALYGEVLKIIDYSPEIDTYLDIICFPTFKGHCGCILFDIAKIKSFRKTSDTERALAMFLEQLMR